MMTVQNAKQSLTFRPTEFTQYPNSLLQTDEQK